jgi:hypothetical protein
MILLSSEARSDVTRVRNFLEARNPRAAMRAMQAIWPRSSASNSSRNPEEPPTIPASGKLSFPSAPPVTSSAIQSCRTIKRSSSPAFGMAAKRGDSDAVRFR